MTGDELQAAYHCAAEVLRYRVMRGQPVPAWLKAHYQQLDNEVRSSRTRQETDTAGEQLEPEWIGTVEAARLLNWTPRQVQRLAADLDGRMCSGRWMFRSQAVRDYAEGTRNGTARGGV